MALFTKDEIKMLGHQDVKFERALQCVENVYHSTARPPASNNAACPSPAAAVRQEDDLDSTTVTCSCKCPFLCTLFLCLLLFDQCLFNSIALGLISSTDPN